jgi:shikimate dehydrogenase
METKKNKVVYGLIGKNISYSFSKEYFNNKFLALKLKNYHYENFDFNSVYQLEKFIAQLPEDVKGLNVTIPYKETIIPFLDDISEEARTIGAVNCIEILPDGKKIGHNTDWIGFKNSLQPFLKTKGTKAMILGTGGASKAVQFALKTLKIPFTIVSRTKSKSNHKTYDTIEEEQINKHTLIINCTPLGTFPNIHSFPEIPFQYLDSKHIVYDLVYNPPMTSLMMKAAIQGAIIKNGYEMLTIQAEENWKIWTK